MDLFVSHYSLRLDAKGRVSIPAPFRAVLARDGFEGLYCYPTLDRPALDAGGNALLKEIEALVARFPPYSEEREQFSAALYGTSEVVKIDGEGRAILTEPLKGHAGIKDEIAFVGLGHKFQIWEPGRFRARTRGGHREGPRAQEAAGLPGARRKVRTEHGNDGEQRQQKSLSLADWLVTFPCSAAAPSSCSRVRDGGVYIDATFGAGGYSREILDAANCSVIGIDRDQQRDRARRRPGAGGRRPAGAGRGAVLQSAGGGARLRPRRGRRRRLRPRRLLDAARGRRARVFVPARWAARHAHGRRRAERGRGGRRRLRARACGHHRGARRGAACACGGARDRRRPPRGADQDHAGAGRDRRARGARASRRHPSGDPHVPGAADVRQRGARRARRRH